MMEYSIGVGEQRGVVIGLLPIRARMVRRMLLQYVSANYNRQEMVNRFS